MDFAFIHRAGSGFERLVDIPDSIYDLRDRAALEVMFGAGLRVAELVSLNWEDLSGGEPGDIRVNAGKGGDDRIAICGEMALKALAGWRRVAWVRDSGGPVFSNSRGERLTVRSIEKMVDKRAARAGLDRIHPHALRHGFATCASGSRARTWPA